MKNIRCVIFFLTLLSQSILYAKQITVIGTGYVGLATAAILSQCRHQVFCYDIDTNKIIQLRRKKLTIYEPKMAQALFNCHLRPRFTNNIFFCKYSTIVYICVGTPTNLDGTFDDSHLFEAIDTALNNCKRMQILCIKSTVQPGTLRKIKQYLINRNRNDIALVYNPEFMREGSALDDILTKNPLVIASDSHEAQNCIEDLYEPITKKNNTKTIKTTFETAEIIKYGWNSFSALRIAFANELALLCKEQNADIFSVIKAIALSEELLPTETLKPGPGFGGSCLPKDTHAFTKSLEQNNLNNSLVHQAISSNNNHKEKIISEIISLLDNNPQKKTVALLGLSFKAGTDDIRHSSAINIIKELQGYNVTIQAYDPHAINNMKKLFPDIQYFDSPYQAVTNADCIVILTEWPEIEYLDLALVSNICNKKVLFDTRNLYNPITLKQYGFRFSNLGRIGNNKEKRLTYDTKYRNISQKTKQPIGIMLVAYNRPHYLKEVLTSIEKNPESQTLPFYFFLEGGPNATQQENIDLITASNIKNKYIIARDRNIGCPKNFIDARRFMFDWCNYEKVIVLEDDTIISPHYFTFLLNLHAWARKKYSNVGIVQAWSYCLLNKKNKVSKLHAVQKSERLVSYVTYCLDKEVWDNIKDVLYFYEQFIDRIPHSQNYDIARSKPKYWKDFSHMKEWARNVMHYQPPKIRNENPFPNSPENSYYEKFFTSNSFVMRQDNMNAFALWLAGYIKIQSVVNRALHIGSEGGLGGTRLTENGIVLDNFSEDQSMIDFVTV